MLINLSNHPVAKWSPAQQSNATELFGETVDMAFPNVDPNASTEAVLALAKEHLFRVLETEKLAHGEPVTVHVMGEMGFTHAFVTLSKEAGIPCVHSTSVRDSIPNPDGSKTAQFRFAQFRAY
jgi:hypothetical protein